MLREEFEKLAGYKVSAEDYHRIIEPMYMATDLDKKAFVKSINKMSGLRKSIERKPEKLIKTMSVMNRYGYTETPNGCWKFIKYVEVVDINLKTGRYVVRYLDEEDLDRLAADGEDLNYSTSYDMHFSKCEDESGKPMSERLYEEFYI